jgi:hypothetical protein
MENETAVQWLRSKIKETYEKEGKVPLAYLLSLVNKAEKKEEELIVMAYRADRYPCSDEDAQDYYDKNYK